MGQRPAECIRVPPAIVVAHADYSRFIRLATCNAQIVDAFVEEALTSSDVTTVSGATVKWKPVVPELRPCGVEDPVGIGQAVRRVGHDALIRHSAFYGILTVGVEFVFGQEAGDDSRAPEGLDQRLVASGEEFTDEVTELRFHRKRSGIVRERTPRLALATSGRTE